MPTDDAAQRSQAPQGQPGTGPATRPAAVPAGDLDARLADLDLLAERPLTEHIEVYQGLHADLQAALAEIDSA